MAEDGDDLVMEAPVVRYKCHSLDYLLTITKFTRNEMRMLYQGFKQECPSGVVTEGLFHAIFARFFPQGDSSQYARLVFKTVTSGQKSKLTFEEFVTTLSRLSRGSADEKIRWLFDLYDVSGCGVITQSEMAIVVHSIYSLLGYETSRSAATAASARTSLTTDMDQALETRISLLFQLMDENGDGIVTYDEFCRWLQKDDGRLQNLRKFDTIFM